MARMGWGRWAARAAAGIVLWTGAGAKLAFGRAPPVPAAEAMAVTACSAVRLQLRGGAEFDPYAPGSYSNAVPGGVKEGEEAPPTERKAELIRQFTSAATAWTRKTVQAGNAQVEAQEEREEEGA